MFFLFRSTTSWPTVTLTDLLSIRLTTTWNGSTGSPCRSCRQSTVAMSPIISRILRNSLGTSRSSDQSWISSKKTKKSISRLVKFILILDFAFHLNFSLFNIFLSSWKLVYVPCSQFTGINFNMIWELVLREGLYIAVTFRVWLVSCVAFFGFRETAMDLTFGMCFFIIFPPTKCFTLRRILGNTFKKLSSSLGCSVPLLVLRNVEGHVQLAHRGHGPVRHQLRSPRRTKDLVLRAPSVRTSAWKSCARHLPKCRFLVTLTLVLFYF